MGSGGRVRAQVRDAKFLAGGRRGTASVGVGETMAMGALGLQLGVMSSSDARRNKISEVRRSRVASTTSPTNGGAMSGGAYMLALTRPRALPVDTIRRWCSWGSSP